MATLLCSILIGAGYPAMVVSGVARADIFLNDQSQTQFPYEIKELKIEEEELKPKAVGQKYKLRPMPHLESHLEENMADMLRQKEDDERRIRDEAARLEAEENEKFSADSYLFEPPHAWVVIIMNAPWRRTNTTVEDNAAPEPPKARFIEPSTGFICETNCKQYILIDSVWDNENYYVNMQKYQRVGEIRWNLQDTTDWEHMLPGEPPEKRISAVDLDENLTNNTQQPQSLGKEEKHLDITRTWVMKLHVGLKEYEERFPKLEKTIYYLRAAHERFSPYSQRDGKVEQITFHTDNEYKEPKIRWQYFENRSDLLQKKKLILETGKVEESFLKGRNDSLRFMEYNSDLSGRKTLHFYSATRVDCLKNVSVKSESITLTYENRADKCIFQEFEFKPDSRVLKKTTEKFEPQTCQRIPTHKDIAMRTILLQQRKVLLKFHYARGALTASTLEFLLPLKPDYGKEVQFDPSRIKAYKSNISEPDLTSLELYNLLLKELKHEGDIKIQFDKLLEEINKIFDCHAQETNEPVLKFSIFNPLYNGAARALRLKQAAEQEALELEISSSPADFLAPYLVTYKNKSLTYKESCAVYNACLTDLKSRFVGLLNDLQCQYENLTAEAQSLKKFLVKFEDQFDQYNYEKLVEQANAISLHKRMVLQRLTLTHEESQKKYEAVKNFLLKDEHLNFVKDSTDEIE